MVLVAGRRSQRRRPHEPLAPIAVGAPWTRDTGEGARGGEARVVASGGRRPGALAAALALTLPAPRR